MHLFLPWQAIPQPPQFSGSLSVLTQLPLQRAYPELHAVPQPLLVQVAVPLLIPGHTVPQAPQFLVSLLVSTQPLPQ